MLYKLSLDYLIDLWLESMYHEPPKTGTDKYGKYEECGGCHKKVYEYDSKLPLEDMCYECLFGREGEIHDER